MTVSESAEPAAAPGSGSFQPLRSGQLLTDLILALRLEMNDPWRNASPRETRPCRILAQVWIEVEANADAALRDDPGDPIASELLGKWRDLDREWGDPVRRLWNLAYLEEYLRARVLVRYLRFTGLTAPKTVEPDAPVYWLAKREQEGE